MKKNGAEWKKGFIKMYNLIKLVSFKEDWQILHEKMFFCSLFLIAVTIQLLQPIEINLFQSWLVHWTMLGLIWCTGVKELASASYLQEYLRHIWSPSNNVLDYPTDCDTYFGERKVLQLNLSCASEDTIRFRVLATCSC